MLKSSSDLFPELDSQIRFSGQHHPWDASLWTLHAPNQQTYSPLRHLPAQQTEVPPFPVFRPHTLTSLPTHPHLIHQQVSCKTQKRVWSMRAPPRVRSIASQTSEWDPREEQTRGPCRPADRDDLDLAPCLHSACILTEQRSRHPWPAMA